jgi:uncharacterized membrane protein
MNHPTAICPDDAPVNQAWTFKRNCSITPRQLGLFYVSLCLLSLTIATVFWFRGAKLVMPFTGLELIALGAALLLYARHASDREELRLTANALEVQCLNGEKLEREALDLRWLKVDASELGLISLSSRGQTIKVGRYMRPERRAVWVRELNAAVTQARSGV